MQSIRKAGAAAALALATAFIGAVPALANSYNYSWTMNNLVVDGKVNHVLHAMLPGQGYLSGSLWTTSKDVPYPPGPYTVHYEVRRDQAYWLDPLMCSRDVQPNASGSATFSLSTCGGQWSTGDYYIVVYKTADDGWNMSGSGTIKTA